MIIGYIANLTVTVEKLEDKSVIRETFSHVIVATGHYSVPSTPHYPGTVFVNTGCSWSNVSILYIGLEVDELFLQVNDMLSGGSNISC